MASSSVKAAPVPASLTGSGRTLWQQIARQWSDDGLEPDARERRLLADACAEASILSVLEVRLAEEIEAGRLIVKGSQGQPVTSSLVNECRRSRAQVHALLGKLAFDESGASIAALGGMTTSEAGRRGGMAKHHGNVYGRGASR